MNNHADLPAPDKQNDIKTESVHLYSYIVNIFKSIFNTFSIKGILGEDSRKQEKENIKIKQILNEKF